MLTTKEIKERISSIPKDIVTAIELDIEVKSNPERPDNLVIAKPVCFNIPIYDKLVIENNALTIRIGTEALVLTIWKSFPTRWILTIYEKR